MDSAICHKPLSVAEECDVVPADSDSLREEVFRIRHEVYCVEKGWEKGVDGKEKDEFDDVAQHVLLRHRQSGDTIGTVRIIPASKVGGLNGLPMARSCPPSTIQHLPAQTTGEISRFALSKRRRLSCRASAMVRLGLMQGTLRLSCELGLTHWCAMMEPTLLRLLAASAIHFKPIGPLVEHHGLRQPAALVVAPLIESVRAEQPAVWQYATIDGSLARQALAA